MSTSCFFNEHFVFLQLTLRVFSIDLRIYSLSIELTYLNTVLLTNEYTTVNFRLITLFLSQ